jgi:hypothetical protein
MARPCAEIVLLNFTTGVRLGTKIIAKWFINFLNRESSDCGTVQHLTEIRQASRFISDTVRSALRQWVDLFLQLFQSVLQ